MTWLQFNHSTIALFDDDGAKALRSLLSEILPYFSDGDLSSGEIKEIRSLLAEIQQAKSDGAQAQFARLVGLSDNQVELLTWLTNSAEETANQKGEEDRIKKWKLLDWQTDFKTPSLSALKTTIELGIDAEIYAGIKKSPIDLPASRLKSLVGLSATMRSNLALSSEHLPAFVDKFAFGAEAQGSKTMEFESLVLNNKTPTARAIATTVNAAANPPHELARVSSAFGDGLDLIKIEDRTSLGAQGEIGLSAPLTTGQIFLGGKFKIGVSAKKKIEKNRISTISQASDGRIVISSKRDRTADASRSMSAGLEVQIATPDLLQEITELVELSDKKLREILKTIAAASDLRSEFRSIVSARLKQGLSEGLAEAIESSLFDGIDEKAVNALLSGKIEALLSDQSTPWLKDKQAQIKTEALEWFATSRMSSLKMGGFALSSHLEGLIDKVFEDVDAAFSKRVTDLAEKLGGASGNVHQLLEELGLPLIPPDVFDDIDALAKHLEDIIKSLLERTEKLKTLLEAASKLTLAAQFVSESHTRDEQIAEVELLFEPTSADAARIYQSAFFAPVTTATALAGQTGLPQGVALSLFSSVVRQRRAAKRAFGLRLAGVSFSTGQLLSADTKIVRIGNQLRIVTANQAKAWRNGLYKENQSVTATYLTDAGDDISLENDDLSQDGWISEAIGSSKEFDAPFLMTIRHEDKSDFREAESDSLLSELARVGLISPTEETHAKSLLVDMRLKNEHQFTSSVELHLKLSRQQITAIASLTNRKSEIEDAYLRQSWAALPANIQEEIHAGLKSMTSSRTQQEMDAMSLFVTVLQQNELGFYRSNLRKAGKGLKGYEKHKAMCFWFELYEQRRLLERFIDLVWAFSASDAENQVFDELLGNWTKPADQVAFSDAELIDQRPICLMRSLMALCELAKAPRPDPFLSIEDIKNGRLDVVSDHV
jgi:hypothetical protein